MHPANAMRTRLFIPSGVTHSNNSSIVQMKATDSLTNNGFERSGSQESSRRYKDSESLGERGEPRDLRQPLGSNGRVPVEVMEGRL